MLPAPQPTRWRTLRTPEGTRPSPRQQQREARNRAEHWYQALREWYVVTRGEVVPRDLSPKRSNTRLMVPVVGNWGSGGVGLWTAQVLTPLGWVSESRLAHLCNADPLLCRVRSGGGLSSLIHSSGTGWNGHKARAYAVAALSLAVAVGDSGGIHHLELLKLGE